jgi:uncharacterized C2H2 Zn-finger protein
MGHVSVFRSWEISAVTPVPSRTLPHTMTPPGFYCYDGDCASEQPPRLFRDQQSLRQHHNKRHKGTKGEDTSMGRALKRKRDAEVTEEQQKRQRLEEARMAAEAACRTPEPAPVWSCDWY